MKMIKGAMKQAELEVGQNYSYYLVKCFLVKVKYREHMQNKSLSLQFSVFKSIAIRIQAFLIFIEESNYILYQK